MNRLEFIAGGRLVMFCPGRNVQKRADNIVNVNEPQGI